MAKESVSWQAHSFSLDRVKAGSELTQPTFTSIWCEVKNTKSCTSTLLYTLILQKETLHLCNSLAVFLNMKVHQISLVNMTMFFVRFGVACSQASYRSQCLYTHHLSPSILKIRTLTSKSSHCTIHMTFQSDSEVSTNPADGIVVHNFCDVECFIWK
jgi:hypothetical protein